MKKICVIAGAALALYMPAITSYASNAYDDSITCAGMYEFMESMTPKSNPQISLIKQARMAWYDHGLGLSKGTPSEYQKDVMAKRDRIKYVAMTEGRAALMDYLGPLSQSCPKGPVIDNDSIVTTKKVSPNPFGFSPASSVKTYIAAKQCAGRYYETVFNKTTPIEKTYFNAFLNLAKEASEISTDEVQKQVNAEADTRSEILLGNKATEGATRIESCDTALKAMKLK